jgi:hypothetical protein
MIGDIIIFVSAKVLDNSMFPVVFIAFLFLVYTQFIYDDI